MTKVHQQANFQPGGFQVAFFFEGKFSFHSNEVYQSNSPLAPRKFAGRREPQNTGKKMSSSAVPFLRILRGLRLKMFSQIRHWVLLRLMTIVE
jgi:hypothetical protein